VDGTISFICAASYVSDKQINSRLAQITTQYYQLRATRATAHTLPEAFAESEVPLGERAVPLVEGFGESKLSAKASRRHCTGEVVFA
jgi:hypothetical protein